MDIIIPELINDTTYYARQFTRNQKGQYQTRLNGAIAQATPIAGVRLGDMPATSTNVSKIKLSGRKLIVLKHNYENSGRTALTEDFLLPNRAFDSGNINEYDGSDIDIWLNGGYFNLFTDIIKSKILNIAIPYTKSAGVSSTILRKVFLLSGTEVGFSGEAQMHIEGTAIPYFNSANRRIAYLESSPTTNRGWWLRSPYVANTAVAWQVGLWGNIDSSGTVSGTGYAVRPAFTLPADMLFYAEPDADGCYLPIL